MKIGGWILSVVLAVFLFFDAITKILSVASVVKASAGSGITADLLPRIGWALLISTILFLWPRTVLVGGILLAAYLGGAVFATLRIHGSAALIALPIVFAVLVWVAITLREENFRAVLLRSAA